MKIVQKLGRLAEPLSLLALAACQTMPGDTTSTQPSTTPSTTAPEPGSAASQERPEALQAERQGAPVAVFLADTEEQAGWRPVQIQSGTLYINPQPVITREDLVDVRAGTSRQGDGLLALGLSELGRKKVENITFPPSSDGSGAAGPDSEGIVTESRDSKNFELELKTLLYGKFVYFYNIAKSYDSQTFDFPSSDPKDELPSVKGLVDDLETISDELIPMREAFEELEQEQAER